VIWEVLERRTEPDRIEADDEISSIIQTPLKIIEITFLQIPVESSFFDIEKMKGDFR